MESHVVYCKFVWLYMFIFSYRVDEYTDIPPALHSDHVTDILYQPQQINGEKKDGRLTI